MMQFLQKLFFSLLLIWVVLACKESDPSVQDNCKYAGQTWMEEFKGVDFNRITEYDSDISLNENGLPINFTTKYTKIERDLVSNIINSGTLEEHQFSFMYDKDGFLTKLTRHRVYALSNGGLQYDNIGVFANGKIEETEISDFVYNSEQVNNIQHQLSVTVSGENRSPVVITSERNETYVYDSKGIPLYSTEVSSNGEKLLRKFDNGKIRSETRNDKNGMTFMVTEYDEAGLGKYVNQSGFEQFIERDVNGNLILIKAYSQNVLISKTTFVYDNKKNPETLISNFFKGIPVPMSMLRRSDGVNNLVKEKYEDLLNGSQSETNWSLTYNASNLPKQAKRVDTSQMTQTFKYLDCE